MLLLENLNTEVKKNWVNFATKMWFTHFGVVRARKGRAFLIQSCYQHLDCRAGFPGAPCGPPLQAMAVTCSCSFASCMPTALFCGNGERRWWWWGNPGARLGYGRQLCLRESWDRYLEAWVLSSWIYSSGVATGMSSSLPKSTLCVKPCSFCPLQHLLAMLT